MRPIIFVVFFKVLYRFINADDCSVSHGLLTSYGSNFANKFAGYVNYMGDQKLTTPNCNAINKNGAQLRVNEDEVSNPANFVRPCALDDLYCIRTFLRDNSGCKPAYGPVPDPLPLNQITFNAPFANLTFTLTDVSLEGLNETEIKEFYYNKKNGNLVIGIEVPKFNETSPVSYFAYQRRGKETTVLADAAHAVFISTFLTAIIPTIPKLRLELADIHAQIVEAAYYIGPKAFTSDDPEVAASIAAFKALPSLVQREGFTFKAQLIFSLYLQSFLCDFGVQLYTI